MSLDIDELERAVSAKAEADRRAAEAAAAAAEAAKARAAESTQDLEILRRIQAKYATATVPESPIVVQSSPARVLAVLKANAGKILTPAEVIAKLPDLPRVRIWNALGRLAETKDSGVRSPGRGQYVYYLPRGPNVGANLERAYTGGTALARILAYVNEHPNQVFSPTDVTEALNLTGRTASDILPRLAARGLIRRADRGRYQALPTTTPPETNSLNSNGATKLL